MKPTIIAAAALVSALCLAQTPAPASVIPTASRPAAVWQYTRVGDLDGVKAVTRLSERLIRGAQPEDLAGMQSLKKLGVLTILSVEEPDLKEIEAAKAVGLEIRNIATEYSGLPKPIIDNLVATYRDLPGTTYVHCHHGKHRGGTAVAVFRMTFEGFTSEEAIAEMFELGCSPRYKGLYDTIATYRPDPAVCHRPIKDAVGLDSAAELTPKLLRAVAAPGDAAWKAAKALGVTRVVLVNGTKEAVASAETAGLKAEVLGLPTTMTAAELEAAKAALTASANDKVLVLGDSMVSVSGVVAGWRMIRSKWTPEEAAKEVEAVAGKEGAALATALRSIKTAK